MDKTELSYRVASQGLGSYVRSQLSSTVVTLITLFILILVGSLSIITGKVRDDLIPSIEEEMSKALEKKRLSQNYSIKSLKPKLVFPSPFYAYQIESDEIKMQNTSSNVLLVIPKFHTEFLNIIKSKNISLEYPKNEMESPYLTYPKPELWLASLQEIKNNTFYLYKLAFSSLIDLLTFTPSSQALPEEPDNSIILHSMIIPLILWYFWHAQNKRRKIFIKSFKKKDLEDAEPCSIKKMKKSKSIYGTKYEVLNKKNIDVIFNGSKADTAKGYLLNYGGINFFIHEKWLKVKQATE
jgi:hypothetical protein